MLQLVKVEIEELVSVAWAIIKPIESCDEEW